jgi:hypothetical protein
LPNLVTLVYVHVKSCLPLISFEKVVFIMIELCTEFRCIVCVVYVQLEIKALAPPKYPLKTVVEEVGG